MSQRPQILAGGGVSAEMRKSLAEHFDVHDLPMEGPEGVAEAIGAQIAGIAVGGWVPMTASVTDHLPALEIVSCYGVGYDGIDAAAMARRNVMVTHTPGVLDDEVANTTIALVLAVTRRIVAQDRYVREGRWVKDGAPPYTRGLAGKTVGILGLGRIGLAIARKLEVFNCSIVYHSRNRRDDVAYPYRADLIEMARECDILINVVPGGPATRHMIDRPVLDAIGPEGTFINIGRGSTVDEAELVAALAEKRLGAAGLDVFEREPHVPEALFAMDNVVLLPHIGSATFETRGAMAKLVVDNLVAWFGDGKAIAPVPECRHLQK